MGKDPVATLNSRLSEMINLNASGRGQTFIDRFQGLVRELESGDSKECLKCEKVYPISEFKDSKLSSGYGRNCKKCKAPKRRRRRAPKAKVNIDPLSLVGTPVKSAKRAAKASKKISCERCSSKMVKRSGRYGEFYGCSKYPKCRNTVNVKKVA